MKQLVISQNITIREYRSLDKYFNEIEKIKPITAEEEVMLSEKIKQGDQAAFERLTKANLRFVISVAKRYQNMGLTLGDLINEGNIGLIIATKRYDETKGFKFISYAVWWIRQSIISALAEHARTVRLPHNKLSLLTKLYKAFTILEQEHNRKPTADELGEYLGVAAFKVSELLKCSGMSLSLSEPFVNENGFTPLEVLQDTGEGPEDKVMFESVKVEIAHSMRVLSHREREILILYFGLGKLPSMTLEEIGNRYDISKEHVGRIRERALQKLRHCTHAPTLKSCLN